MLPPYQMLHDFVAKVGHPRDNLPEIPIAGMARAYSPLSQGAICAAGANGGVEAHVGARSMRSKLWGELMRSMTPNKTIV